MKTFKNILMIMALLPIMLVISCKDSSDPEPINQPFEIMTQYMIENNMDVGTVLSDWIVGAPAEGDVNTFLSNYSILDIRDPTTFGNGHVEGAVNTTLTNIVSAAQSTTKPILVMCYSGQSACHAVVALRLSGYPDAKVFKFGMSGWSSQMSGSWDNNIGDIGVNHQNWTTGPVLSNTTYQLPALNATATTGAAILAERVDFMVNNGFQGVSGADVLANPGDYFINNFWDQGDVDTYGHIDQAYRIKPLTLAGGEMANLDPDETIVTYCWTGQTSSMMTAYLTVLGYNAKSLKFGTNGMIYSSLKSHKYSTPSVDLPVVTD